MSGAAALRDAADRIGDRLVTDAIWHEGACTWIGAGMEPDGDRWELVHRSCGGDLYEGTAGVAVFLARLAQVTGDHRQRDTALGAIRHALGWLDRTGDLSLYGGATGVAWASASVAADTGEDHLAGAASALAERVAGAVAAGALPATDYMSGRAGVVAGLTALAAGEGGGQLLERAGAIADGLVAAGVTDGVGRSWPVGGDEPGLCGLGHGAAGVAAALRELAAATGEQTWTAAAEAAERYERGWFHPEQPGWPDLRGLDRSGLAGGAALSYPAFWCHGAGGIGLQRLRAHELSGGESALADAGAALQAAVEAAAVLLAPAPDAPPPDLATNPSLCHGAATLADLVGYAARLFGQAPHRDLAERLGAYLAAVTDGTVRAWPSGVVGGGETPGLLLGWSGVGEVLLRLAGAGPRGPVGLVTPPGRPS